MVCQVQREGGRPCGNTAHVLWDWGGPTLRMCGEHDTQMREHVARCKRCRVRLVRSLLTSHMAEKGNPQ